MNILFDFITIQYGAGGASEYVRRVFYALHDACKLENCDVKLIGVIDSSLSRNTYDDFSTERIKEACSEVVDIHGRSLSSIVSEYQIDKIFVGLSQLWASHYRFDDVDCEVITITHDVHDEELESIRLYSYLSLFGTPVAKFRQFLSRTLKLGRKWIGKEKHPMTDMVSVLNRNPLWKCVVVSEYSKYSCIYHLAVHEDKVRVLWSPERMMLCNDDKIENKQLNEVIASGMKYYLIVSAGRSGKNAAKAICAFDYYRNVYLKEKQSGTSETQRNDGEPILVTLGMGCGAQCPGHLDIASLSESDLVHAYRHCYALIYPSFFEGFGYPPVEAMKYGAPVLASNVTSMTDVLGEAAIYFSPFYLSGMFKALCTLNDTNRADYVQKSVERYKMVSEKQSNDLQQLIELIIG